MFRYAAVDVEGKIVSVYQGSKQFVACPEHVTDSDYFYSFDDAAFVEKERLQISITATGLSATLSGVPLSSVLEVDGHEMVVQSGGVELEFDTPGTYVVTVSPPKEFHPEELEVTVG